MKRLLLALILLASSAQAGTMMMLGAGPGAATGGFTPGCTQSSNFLARTSGLSTTERNAYDTMICGMVTDGDFAKLDGLYIFATNTTTTANLNLISTSFGLTQTGTVTFSADHGYTGDASTGFLNTSFTPSTASGHYALNSASLGAYILTNRTSAAGYSAMGTDDTATGTLLDKLIAHFTGPTSQFGNGSCSSSFTSSTAQGQWVGVRSSAANSGFWRNGSSVASSTGCSTAGALASCSIIILARRTTTACSLAQPSGDQFAAAFFGSGGISATNVSSRINAYMTALGINVY